MQSNQSFVSIANHPVIPIYEVAKGLLDTAKKFSADCLARAVDKNKVTTQAEEDRQHLNWLQGLPGYELEEPNELVVYSLDELERPNDEANKGPFVISKGARSAYAKFKDYHISLATEVEFKCPGPEEEYDLLEKERQRVISEWGEGEWPSKEYRKFTHLRNKRAWETKRDFCFKDYRKKWYQLCLLVNSLIDRWSWDGESFKQKAQDDLTLQFSEYLYLEFRISFLVGRLKYLKEGNQPNLFKTCPSNKELKQHKSPLSLAQIALFNIYQGIDIDQTNADKILEDYPHKSAIKLIKKFNDLKSSMNRTGEGPAAGVSADQRVKDISIVIDNLIEINLMDAASKAKKELIELKENIYNDKGY